MTARSRRAWWWAAWCAVVFALFDSCANHREAQHTGDRLASGNWTPSVGLAVSAVRGACNDDGDLARYLAYVNAAFGRPYQGYYVRPLEGWKVDTSHLYTGRDVNDPQIVPPVVPAAPLVPYKDFLVEYPPGFFLLAMPPALFAPGLDGYRILFSAFMALLLTLALVACERIASRIAPLRAQALLPWAAAMALALGIISVRRYDPVVSLSLCGLVLGCVARRPMLAGIAFSLGVVAKGVPLLLAPLPLLYWISLRRWRELVVASSAAAAVGLAVAVPFANVARAQVLDLLAFHGQRPLQIESTGGALLAILRQIDPASATVSNTYGSANIGGRWEAVPRLLAGLLPLAASAAIGVWSWSALRRAKNDAEAGVVLVRGLCATLVAMMALGKVFSPQYVTWLLPLGVLASVLDRKPARVLLLAAFALTQVIYPFVYKAVVLDSIPPAFGLIVLTRNALLIAWGAWLIRPGAMRGERDGEGLAVGVTGQFEFQGSR